MESPRKWMESAIATAVQGIEAGQTPFGTAIVRDGRLVTAAHNTVWQDCDPTAHAEVNAIRKATQALKTINLAGCTLFSTCEPCPMCLTAIHWAKIDRVFFGATIADAEGAGFHELRLSARDMVIQGGSPLKVESGLLEKECRELFTLFKTAGKAKIY